MTEIGILGEREDRRKKSAENRRRFEEIVKELEAEVAAETAREKLEARLRPKAAKPAEDVKPSETAQSSVSSGSLYELMDRTDTYALGAHALRKACDSANPTFAKKDGSGIYRPLTFEENIRARLDDYNTLNNPDGRKRSDEDRLRLFNTWLDSCTGIAYKKGATLFKMITESEDLIGIKKDFDGASLPVQYSQLQGVELDSSQGVYNQLLTNNQVLDHPAWNEAVTDKALLNEYVNLVFRLRNGNNMRFWVRQNTSADELRALCVYDLGSNSNANSKSNLNINGRFVRVTHGAEGALRQKK